MRPNITNMNPDDFETIAVNRFDTMLSILWFMENIKNIINVINCWCSSYADFRFYALIQVSVACRRHISKGDNNYKETENTVVHYRTVEPTGSQVTMEGA